MRSARKNIGEHSANPSSLPAAGRPDEAVSHSRWRHIGTYIVSFSNVLGPVRMGWFVPFSLGEFLVEGPLLARLRPVVVVTMSLREVRVEIFCPASGEVGRRERSRAASGLCIRTRAQERRRIGAGGQDEQHGLESGSGTRGG